MRKTYKLLPFLLAVIGISLPCKTIAQRTVTPPPTKVVLTEIAENATDFPENTHWYFMSIRGKLLTYTSTNNYVDAQTLSKAFDGSLWCVAGNVTDGYRIYNKAAGATKVLSSANATASNVGTTYPIPTTITEINASTNNKTWDFFSYTSGNDTYLGIAQHGNTVAALNDYGGYGKLAYWTSPDAGSGVVFYEATNSVVPTEMTTGASLFPTGTNWYTMQITANKNYIGNNGEETSISLTRTATEYAQGDLWCFVGNHTEGYRIYNKEAGTTKILSSSTSVSGQDGTTYPVLTEEASLPQGNNTKWDIFSLVWNGKVECLVAQHDNAANKINKRGNSLAYWYNNYDGGSVVYLTNYTKKVQDETDDIVNGVGFVYGASASDANLVQAAAAAVADDASAENIAAYKDAVTTANATSPIHPTYGRYYRIVSAAKTNGGAWRSVYVNHSENKLYWGTTDKSSVDHLWKLDGKALSGVALKAPNLKKYITGSDLSQATEEVANAQFAAAYMGNAVFVLTHNTTTKLNADGYTSGNGGEVSNTASGDGQLWYLQPVNSIDVTIASGREYATLTLPFSVKIPDGIKVYFASSASESVVTLTEITGGVIPAETPVIISGSPKTYTFDISYDTEATAVSINLLTGILAPYALPADNYVLASGANGEGFYKTSGNGVTPANKAYIASGFINPNGNSGLSFVGFNFNNLTGIGSVATSENEAAEVYYELNGMRVKTPVSGRIYVTSSGKKVMFK